MKTVHLTEEQIKDISCILQNIHLIPLFADKKGLAKILIRKLNAKQPKEMVKIVIKDFTKDKDEPAYDVECYINGKFDGTHDGVFSTRGSTKAGALAKALSHVVQKLLTYARNNNM